MDVLLHNGWTYISILYSEGTYGEHASKLIDNGVKTRGICVEYNKKILSTTSETEYSFIIKRLRTSGPRVVLLYIEGMHRTMLGDALIKAGYIVGELMWVAGDGFGLAELDPIFDKVITTSYSYRLHPLFTDYYFSLTQENNPNNPWFQRMYELEDRCVQNLTSTSDVRQCYKYDYLKGGKRTMVDYSSTTFDGFFTVAHALDSLIKKDCPDVLEKFSLKPITPEDRVALRECVTGPRLLDELKDVSFYGISGWVKFDTNGDVLSPIQIVQYHDSISKTLNIGEWRMEEHQNVLYINSSQIDWTIYNKFKPPKGVFKKHNFLPQSLTETPSSICSISCVARQYKIQRELPCCWECRWTLEYNSDRK